MIVSIIYAVRAELTATLEQSMVQKANCARLMRDKKSNSNLDKSLTNISLTTHFSFNRRNMALIP